jgi:1-aminocyclopropane-1-carboxylate deaminase
MFFYQNNISSPLQRIEDDRLDAYNIRLYIKRDDLLHPSVSGNKFRKLKYNLQELQRLGKRGLVTFGGAFSNHIHATAAAGQLLGIPTVGIIRGERPLVLSTTLTFAESCGMTLHFVSRAEYRDKDLIFKNLESQYANYYWLPEGGSNTLAMQGTAEIVPEIIADLGASPDYICVACGTGGTVAGIVSSATILPNPINVLGFAALKGDFLENEVEQLLINAAQPKFEIRNPILSFSRNTEGPRFEEKKHWAIQTDYPFGGYAKWTMPLVDFINDFKQKHHIQLDPVYTGKMLYGVFDLIEKGFFSKNATIVAVHTGGLQGIEGFNGRFLGVIDTV